MLEAVNFSLKMAVLGNSVLLLQVSEIIISSSSRLPPRTHPVSRRSDGGDFMTGKQLLIVEKLWVVVEDDVQGRAVVAT